MFKSDASLFLSANNNLGFAKTYINECKRLISEFELSDNNDCAVLKESLNNCDIDTLVTKVDTTKQNLFKIDQDFANKYMSLLQEQIQNGTIDTSKMSAEEKAQYSIQMGNYERDYHENLLFILEGYEEQGLLTDEMREVLAYERLVVERYGVQDKMSLVNPTTDKYLELFKQYSGLDRQIINANPSLSAEDKATLLSNYEESYNTRLGEIQAGIDARQKSENDYAELQDLYRQKEENDDFWHPIIEGELQDAIIAKKIEMGIATDSEIEYSNMGDWDKFWANTGTFVASTYTGLFGVTESIADGAVMIAGGVGSLFGADTQWAEDFVKTDYKSELYDGIRLSTGMNEITAYSGWHNAGEIFGTTVGYVAASYAAPWATAAIGGLSAMGNASSTALNSGASFEEALGVGTIAGVAGAASGYGVSALGAAAAGSTSLMQVGGYTLAGMGVSALEPIVNTVAEYGFYAKDMVDENGNPIYDNIWDYYVNGGGLLNTGIAVASSGIGIGSKGLKGYNNYKTVAAGVNMKHLAPEDVQDIARRFKNLSDKQVWEVVQGSNNDYFKNVTLKQYNLITPKNAGEFIVYTGPNSNYGNIAGFNLDWNGYGGYIPSTLTSFENLIDASPDGKIYASRYGSDAGHAWSSDWDSTASQRAIPVDGVEASAGVIDGRRYIEAIDICSSSTDKASRVRQLMDAGYDKSIAAEMVSEYDSWGDLPEIGGDNGLNSVLSPSQRSKYGYSGLAAPWKTKSVNMTGGGTQVTSVFSWGTLRDSGIMSDMKTITIS